MFVKIVGSLELSSFNFIALIVVVVVVVVVYNCKTLIKNVCLSSEQ
jgi:hypothetical protein